MHVLIIGAGVGGLSLAQTLRNQNVSFEIFERDNHADARFQGWAIAMHSYAPLHVAGQGGAPWTVTVLTRIL